MSDLYNTLHLIVRHVREKNAMYGRVVPEVPKMDVLAASARLTNRIFEFAENHSANRLMRIAEDNVIDSNERAEFDAILEDLQEIVAAALALRCAQSEQGQE